MTKEREQLELAAKACRLIPAMFRGNDNFMFGVLSWFKPHLDDGDCARMEAALDIETLWRQDRVGAVYIPALICKYELLEDHAGDKNAARRAASVAVAAEIGRLK